MYFRRKNGMKGLGFDYSSIMSLFTGGSGGGSGSGEGSSSSSSATARTDTTVTTSVSPQISPNFIQQQDSPNSPVNASVSQAGVPAIFTPAGGGTPATGMIPGFDYASGFAPTGLPTGMQNAGLNTNNLLMAGAAFLGIAILMKNKKSKRR